MDVLLLAGMTIPTLVPLTMIVVVDELPDSIAKESTATSLATPGISEGPFDTEDVTEDVIEVEIEIGDTEDVDGLSEVTAKGDAEETEAVDVDASDIAMESELEFWTW